jgi:autotransporter-associated beta strand protein
MAQAAQSDWCVAGDFNGWDTSSTPLYDDGTHGDLIAGDGVYALAHTYAAAGLHQWKAVECGTWNGAPPGGNAWAYTTAANQTVIFQLDTNDYSADAGAMLYPTQNVVHSLGDDLPTSFTAVGDFNGWTNDDPATLMEDMGGGFYRLELQIAVAGSYIGKVTETGTWNAYGLQGRSTDAGNLDFTTTVAGETVVFLLDTNTSRVTVTQHDTPAAGDWCVAGGFNGWDNAALPLSDGGTNGDLLGGDGIFSRDVAIAAAGRSEWKVLECGTWNNTMPQNAWVITTASDQTVKFTYDTNDRSADAGWPFYPQQNIPNALGDTFPTTFTAVGDWQGWSPNNPATEMTPLGNDLFILNAPLDAGNYEGKVTNDTWSNQVGGHGRSINGSTIPFTVASDGDVVSFVLNGRTGRLAIIAPPPPEKASHDNNIWWSDLGHNSRDPLYRTPTGAVTLGTAVTLRLRAASGDLTGARVRLWDDRNNVQIMLNMALAADDGVYEWWEATLDTGMEPTIYWYRFIAIDGTATAYYEDDSARTGGWGRTFAESPDNSWQLTVYNPAFDSPDWVKNGVIYQVFPERFRDGDPTNNNAAGEFHYDIPGGSIVRSTGEDWNTPLCDPRDAEGDCPQVWGQNFYGGDLQGIIDQMDYLDDLGVTILYLNPVFESPSNHKYDTTDFSVIDDNFGDLDTFLALIAAAEARDMKIVLDGVFNHASSDSIYFDRYGRYDSVGACESIDSPYRDWYYFEDVEPGEGICVGSDGTPNAAVYESWWGYDSLPRMRSTHPEVRDMIWEGGNDSIAPYWINHGAAGWRFDVAADVDSGATNDPTNDYWEGFRAVVRAIDPESYMVGEEWGNSTPWLLEPEWDASMNYQFGSAIMSFWRDSPFTDNDFNSGSSAGPLNPITPSQLEERLRYLQERYPEEAFYAMMNLLGSHDTNRALFLLDHNAHLNDPTLYQNPLYDWSDAITRLKGVALLQITMPGAPTIYYGDEVGLVGPVAYAGDKWEDDPYNRLPFPWLDETGTPFYTHLQTQTGQDALRDYYKLLIAARNAHPALRTGDFTTLLVDDDAMLYGYGRKLADNSDAALVVANRHTAAQDAALDVSGYLPAGATFVDVLNGDAVYTVDGSGVLTITAVPTMSGALLVLSGTLETPPDAVVDLAIVEGDGELTLSWSAATGADSYDIYRSLVSGGGYAFVANTANLVYTDTGLINARNYYYVIYSRDDATLLISEASNEAMGMPHASIDWANLQWPDEITHTVGITPTEDIYGQVYIAGVTPAPGAAPGLIAQLGYGPVAAAPAEWTLWLDAGFNGNAGNNDEFAAQLTPEAAGEYYYLYRYSTTAGREWVYADRSGLIDATAVVTPGLLHVLPSADTTPPAIPQNLVVTGWSVGHIALAWDAVADADLYAYELYRYGEGETAGDAIKVARIQAPAITFRDESVTTGKTYTYTVSALDIHFNESDLSNEASAIAEARMVEVVFNVTVPAYTPATATIYIAGDSAEAFGAVWSPGAQPITRLSATQWAYTATISDGAVLQYKYTRGDWDTVENWGPIKDLANRDLTVDYGETGVMVVNNVIHNWRDPLVIDHYPAAGGTDWDVNAPITVTFNRNLKTTLINTATFAVEGLAAGPVAGDFGFAQHVDTAVDDIYGTINITGTIVTFTPTTALSLDDGYAVTLDAAGFVEEVSMRRDYTWMFGTFPQLPHIEVVPPTLEITLTEGVTATHYLTVSNTGTANLVWQLLMDPDVAWLTVEWETVLGLPIITEPGDYDLATALFDTAGLTPGIYTTTLIISSNDPAHPQITIPVTLTVPCEAVEIISLTSDSPVELGATMHFTATVTGSQPIIYTWDFGGAGVRGGTDANPTFIYASEGTYTVALTVTNGCGTVMQEIVVTVQKTSYDIFLPLVMKASS